MRDCHLKFPYILLTMEFRIVCYSVNPSPNLPTLNDFLFLQQQEWPTLRYFQLKYPQQDDSSAATCQFF